MSDDDVIFQDGASSYTQSYTTPLLVVVQNSHQVDMLWRLTNCRIIIIILNISIRRKSRKRC